MIIGLYGESRCGKDSVAAVLVKDFGYEQRAMAGAIRDILVGMNPVIKDNGGVVWELLDLFDQCHGDWDRIKAMSSEATDYMIRLGQTCRDVLGETVWLNKVLPPCSCESFQLVTYSGSVTRVDCTCTPSVVISDVRQPNEYREIKARGGQVWKVIRPGLTRRGMDGLLDDLDFDARIDNLGSLEDLRSIVQSIITSKADEKKKERYGFRF